METATTAPTPAQSCRRPRWESPVSGHDSGIEATWLIATSALGGQYQGGRGSEGPVNPPVIRATLPFKMLDMSGAFQVRKPRSSSKVSWGASSWSVCPQSIARPRTSAAFSRHVSITS
jgi:hypothetical protein